MRKIITYCLLISLIGTTTSCSKYLQTGNGGFTDVSLNRSSDEYTIKRLNSIELNGNAICGIPGFGGVNNKNKNKTGMMFRFNGIQIGRVPRIAPILSMAAFTLGYGVLAQQVAGEKKIDRYYNEYKLKSGLQFLVALPFAGATNNILWNGIAASGLTNQIYYQLIDENPGVDVFITPKFKIDYKLDIFTQKATIKADVTGATLKMK